MENDEEPYQCPEIESLIGFTSSSSLSNKETGVSLSDLSARSVAIILSRRDSIDPGAINIAWVLSRMSSGPAIQVPGWRLLSKCMSVLGSPNDRVGACIHRGLRDWDRNLPVSELLQLLVVAYSDVVVHRSDGANIEVIDEDPLF